MLWQFGLFYGNLVYFVVIWYIFLRFGMFYKEKSGNRGTEHRVFVEQSSDTKCTCQPFPPPKMEMIDS
jgi:hypothetical protein